MQHPECNKPRFRERDEQSGPRNRVFKGNEMSPDRFRPSPFNKPHHERHQGFAGTDFICRNVWVGLLDAQLPALLRPHLCIAASKQAVQLHLWRREQQAHAAARRSVLQYLTTV